MKISYTIRDAEFNYKYRIKNIYKIKLIFKSDMHIREMKYIYLIFLIVFLLIS